MSEICVYTLTRRLVAAEHLCSVLTSSHATWLEDSVSCIFASRHPNRMGICRHDKSIYLHQHFSQLFKNIHWQLVSWYIMYDFSLFVYEHYPNLHGICIANF